jgi:hypothetical protein
MEEKVLGSQEIKPAENTGTTETPKIGGIQTTTAPTAGVDMNFYPQGNPADRIFAGKSTGEQSADPWNKASNTIAQISNNGLTDIQQNHINTIGTERGGQQSVGVAGIGDTYMTGRYSSPMVANLVSSFRTTAAQNALSTELENEKKRLTDEAQKAYKARQKRDRARAEAAARAAAQAQQAEIARKVAGMGNVQGEATVGVGKDGNYTNLNIDGNAEDVKALLDKGIVKLDPKTGNYYNTGVSNHDYAKAFNERKDIQGANNTPAGTKAIVDHYNNNTDNLKQWGNFLHLW